MPVATVRRAVGTDKGAPVGFANGIPCATARARPRQPSRAEPRRRRPARLVGASTITRTSGSVPLGRSSTRPVAAELGLGLGDRRLQRRAVVATRVLVDAADVDQHLRQPVHHRRQLGERLARRGDPGQQVQRGQQRRRRWWRGRACTTWPDCSPPSDEAAGAHRLEHVAVADRGLDDGDALALHRHAGSRGWTSPSRRRCRAASRPALAHREGEHRRGSGRRRRPSPAASTARQRSASPSWAMPTSAPCSTHGGLQRLQVGRAAAVVDVEAVRARRRSRRPRRTGAAQRLGRDLGGGAVGAVDDDASARPAGAAGSTSRCVDVALGGRRRAAGSGRPPRRSGAAQASRMPRLDGVLELVGAACGRRGRRT